MKLPYLLEWTTLKRRVQRSKYVWADEAKVMRKAHALSMQGSTVYVTTPSGERIVVDDNIAPSFLARLTGPKSKCE